MARGPSRHPRRFGAGHGITVRFLTTLSICSNQTLSYFDTIACMTRSDPCEGKRSTRCSRYTESVFNGIVQAPVLVLVLVSCLTSATRTRMDETRVSV